MPGTKVEFPDFLRKSHNGCGWLHPIMRKLMVTICHHPCHHYVQDVPWKISWSQPTACEAPRDQGGVGCHVQSISHALSETNAGHRHKDVTCQVMSGDVRWCQVMSGASRNAIPGSSVIPGRPKAASRACGEEALQKGHQQRWERNELGVISDAMSSGDGSKTKVCQVKLLIAWIPSNSAIQTPEFAM